MCCIYIYIYIYIYIIGERETKRKRGKKDGREERETKFFIFCDCVIYINYFIELYVKIRTKMLGVLLNELIK